MFIQCPFSKTYYEVEKDDYDKSQIVFEEKLLPIVAAAFHLEYFVMDLKNDGKEVNENILDLLQKEMEYIDNLVNFDRDIVTYDQDAMLIVFQVLKEHDIKFALPDWLDVPILSSKTEIEQREIINRWLFIIKLVSVFVVLVERVVLFKDQTIPFIPQKLEDKCAFIICTSLNAGLEPHGFFRDVILYDLIAKSIVDPLCDEKWIFKYLKNSKLTRDD